ncbi:MAG: poly(R)-hydroxyalkanoic acid synthase subunit PhaE [Thermonemataceae bacterium]|nr:poly(R)-hydroxyalkanoic acid synthase subunit PhaE [Thermonemataceae bacterium]
MNKPYNFFETWMKDLQKQETNPMQAYQAYLQQWFQPEQPKKAELGSPEFFQEMLNSQMEMGKLWLGNVQTMFENFAPKRKEASLFEQWSKMYGLWNQDLGKPFAGSPMKSNAAETFSQIMNYSQSYMKMYELWQPFLEQLNTGKKPKKTALQELMANFSFDKYNQVIENVLGNITPKQSEGFLEQINDFTKKLLQNINEQMGVATEKGMGEMSELFNNFQETQYNVLGKVQKGVAPFLKMVPDSKEKQLLELSLKMQNDYAQYYVKSNEMQVLVQQTAQKGVEKTFKVLLDSLNKEPSKVLTYEDFFNTWLNITEPMVIEVYRTQEFGKLQAESLEISTAIKNHFEKQLEILLEPLPIAPRSEIDELNAIIHELRVKVRNLEQQLTEQQSIEEVQILPITKASRKTKNTNSSNEQ